MNHRKHILVTIIAVVASLTCFAQATSPSQRAKIDSLKKKADLAKDSTKVNYLNMLGFEYGHLNSDTDQHWDFWNPDTARIFLSEAYRTATEVNYIKGVADALSLLSEIASDSDFANAEIYIRQAIPLYEKIHAEKELNLATLGLGWYVFAQSRYDEARLLYQKALPYFIRIDNKAKQAMTYRMLAMAYGHQDYTDKAFEYTRKNDSVAKTIKVMDAKNAIYSPLGLGEMYEAAGDHQKALEYFKKSAEAEARLHNNLRDIHKRMADAFFNIGQFDSCRYYLALSSPAEKSILRNTGIGYSYLVQKNYDQALPYYMNYLEFAKERHDNNQVMFTIRDIARIYEAQKKYRDCIIYGTILVKLAQSVRARGLLGEGYQLCWTAYGSLGKTDSAYKYHLLYTAMNDSLRDNEFVKNMAVYEMKSREAQQNSNIALLNKENELKKNQLRGERTMRNIFAGILICGLLIAILFIRNTRLRRKKEQLQQLISDATVQLEKRRKEQQLFELEREKKELEMQALRAQMSPHFIFNSLNSINRFILQNNRIQASEYLTKFSKLVRSILQNSQASLITIESELESLQLYLEMETLRFNYHFTHKISVQKDLDIEILKVPPLIIQPYVENAIWHGLMHKEGKGQLFIDISQENNTLFFRIMDNGIGRQKSSELASKSATKHKSMGLRITSHRIAIMQNLSADDSPVTINDLVEANGEPAGTEVIIKIPVIYD